MQNLNPNISYLPCRSESRMALFPGRGCLTALPPYGLTALVPRCLVAMIFFRPGMSSSTFTLTLRNTCRAFTAFNPPPHNVDDPLHLASFIWRIATSLRDAVYLVYAYSCSSIPSSVSPQYPYERPSLAIPSPRVLRSAHLIPQARLRLCFESPILRFV